MQEKLENVILRIVNSRPAGAQKKVDQTQTLQKTFIRGCIIVGCSVRRRSLYAQSSRQRDPQIDRMDLKFWSFC